MTIRHVHQYPIFNREAEDRLLGTLLNANNYMAEIGLMLNKEDFYDHGNALIFERMAEMYCAKRQFGVSSLHDRLQQDGLEAETGGVDFLNRISIYDLSQDETLQMVRVIKDCSLRRQVMSISRWLEENACKAGKPIRKSISEAQEKLRSIAG